MADFTFFLLVLGIVIADSAFIWYVTRHET